MLLGLSLVAESGGYSLVAVCGLLTVVASRVVEHRLWGLRASVVAAPGLSSTGLVVEVPGLSFTLTCRIFLDQGSSPVSCTGRQILYQ